MDRLIDPLYGQPVAPRNRNRNRNPPQPAAKPKTASSTLPPPTSSCRASLDQLPPEIIDEIVTYLNLEMPKKAVQEMGGEAWKLERLMFAMLLNYCICDLCCPDEPLPDRRDVDVFPLPVKDGVNSLSSVNKRLRAMTLDSSRKRSVMHMFDDIENSLKSAKPASTTPTKKKTTAPAKTIHPAWTVPPARIQPRAKRSANRSASPRVPAKPSFAADGTPIHHSRSVEEEEVLPEEWERDKHGIRYSSEEEEEEEEDWPLLASGENPDGSRRDLTGEEKQYEIAYYRHEWELKKQYLLLPDEESEQSKGTSAKDEMPQYEPDHSWPQASQANPSEKVGAEDGVHDQIRNLVIGFNHHLRAGKRAIGLSGIDFLKQYPNLRALLIDWYRLPSSMQSNQSSSGISDPLTPVISETLERLDVRLSESPGAYIVDGIQLARQLAGILRRLQLPNLRQFQLIHRMPSERRFVKDNWQTIMSGLTNVDFPKLEVVRVSLWLGGGPLKHPFWLWKTALRDLLEHFRSQGRRPKIVLCIFYDISDFNDLNLNTGHFSDPNLRPSLSPSHETMEKFMEANVRPFPDTSDFDLVIHAAPAEDVQYGADRPHVPIVSVQYRKSAGSAPKKTTTSAAPRKDFEYKVHSREMGRLAGEVSSYDGEDEEMLMRAAYHQMARHIERNPHLMAELSRMDG